MELKAEIKNLGDLKKFVAQIEGLGATDAAEIKGRVTVGGKIKELSAKVEDMTNYKGSKETF